jgi:hypothetical protein
MVGLGVAVLSIALRMSARFFIAGGFFPNIGSDDICIMVALVLIGGISGCAFIRKHNHNLEMAESWLTSKQSQRMASEKTSGLSRSRQSHDFYTYVQYGRPFLTSTDNRFTDLLCQRDPLHHHPASDQGIDHFHVPTDLPGEVIPMAGVLCDCSEHRLRYRIPYSHSLAVPANFFCLEQMGQGAQGHLHGSQRSSDGGSGNVC